MRQRCVEYEVAMAAGSGIEYGAPVGGIVFGDRDRPPVARRPAERRSMARPGIQGFATVYNRVHVHKGRLEAFAPGCFARSICGDRAIRFLIGHQNARLVATRADRLELADCDTGLAFRLAVPDTEEGREALEAVETYEQCACSVGYEERHVDTRVIEGESIRIIRDASLDEISIVRRAAVKETFCTVIDLANASSLREHIRSGYIGMDGALQKLRTALLGMAPS